MSDVIDKIKCLSFRLPKDYEGFDGKNRAVMLDDVIDILNEQPKLDNNLSEFDKWTPCSERLPSESGLYLATYEYEDEITVDVMFFVGKQFYYPEDMIGSAGKSVEVIAWQPLPEPYKGE